MASFNPQKTYIPEPIRVYNSRETTARRVELPSKGAKSITLGDKMFARLILRGKTVLEFMITSVRDLTELYTLLHSKCRGFRGLAKLYLRNMSKGWSEERPLMLYPEHTVASKKYDTLSCNSIGRRCYKAQPSTHITMQDTSYSRYFKGEVQQLSFPWQL